MRGATLLLIMTALAICACGCITRTDKETGVRRTFVVPTMSVVTESKTETATDRNVVFLPLVIAKRTHSGTDGASCRKLFIAPLATSSERTVDAGGGRQSLFVSIPLLTVSKGWEAADGKSYDKETQCAVILYGSRKSLLEGVSSRSWYITPLFLYRRVGAKKEFRLFFIPIPLSRGEAVPLPE
ncbi:MAG: hypothetical protein ABIH04_10740 [Planctomycetota bacterium]